MHRASCIVSIQTNDLLHLPERSEGESLNLRACLGFILWTANVYYLNLTTAFLSPVALLRSSKMAL
jgi:hypothetical protein